MRVQHLIISKEQPSPVEIWSTCACMGGGTRTPDNGDTLTFDRRIPAWWSCTNTLNAMCEALRRTHVLFPSHNQRRFEQICLQTHSTFITCHLYSSTMNKTSGRILNAGSTLKMQRGPSNRFLMSPIGRRSHVTRPASSVSCLPDTAALFLRHTYVGALLSRTSLLLHCVVSSVPVRRSETAKIVNKPRNAAINK